MKKTARKNDFEFNDAEVKNRGIDSAQNKVGLHGSRNADRAYPLNQGNFKRQPKNSGIADEDDVAGNVSKRRADEDELREEQGLLTESSRTGADPDEINDEDVDDSKGQDENEKSAF